MRIFGRALLGAALLLSTLPAFNQAFADGSGVFEGAVITKIAGLDAIGSALGSGNATQPFVDSIDWHGMNDTDSFFVFRYCDDPTNCVIGSATPDGKFIEMAFDPPGQYSSLTGARISSGGDALLFKATRGEESEELYILLKGANSLVQLTNGTQVPAYSWMEDARVAYSELKAEVSCEGGISGGQCNDPQYNADSRIWVSRPTGENVRTLY